MYTVHIMHGGNTSLDDKLDEIVGKRSDGSGTDMMTGFLDMSWDFRDKKRATDAAKKLKKADIRGLNVIAVTDNKGPVATYKLTRTAEKQYKPEYAKMLKAVMV